MNRRCWPKAGIEPGEQVVEGEGQPAQLVARVGHRQRPAQVVGAHPSRLLGHGHHGSQALAGQEPASEALTSAATGTAQ